MAMFLPSPEIVLAKVPKYGKKRMGYLSYLEITLGFRMVELDWQETNVLNMKRPKLNAIWQTTKGFRILIWLKQHTLCRHNFGHQHREIIQNHTSKMPPPTHI